MRVLVLEEDDDHRALLRIMFEAEGCDVRTAGSVDAGFQAFENTSFDLVVFELNLPGGGACEFADWVAATHPGTSLVACSVLDFSSYPARYGSLPKPITRTNVRKLLL